MARYPSHMQVVPGKRLLLALAAGAAATLIALVAGAGVAKVAPLSAVLLLLLAALASADYVISRRAWQQSAVRMTRRLPAAFALGAKRPVSLSFEVAGPHGWHGQVYDHIDPSF